MASWRDAILAEPVMAEPMVTDPAPRLSEDTSQTTCGSSWRGEVGLAEDFAGDTEAQEWGEPPASLTTHWRDSVATAGGRKRGYPEEEWSGRDAGGWEPARPAGAWGPAEPSWGRPPPESSWAPADTAWGPGRPGQFRGPPGDQWHPANRFQPPGPGFDERREYGRPPTPPLPTRRVPLMALEKPERGTDDLSAYVMVGGSSIFQVRTKGQPSQSQEDRMDWDSGSGQPSSQDSFSRHLLGAFGFFRLPDPEDATLNDAHPAFKAEPSKDDWLMDGPPEWQPYFDHAASQWIFDQSYETSIWDYDPKFIWDYLPETKRGQLKKIPGVTFLMGTDYTKSEMAWKKYEKTSEKQWKNNFVPLVKEAARCRELGLPEPPLTKKKKTNDPADQPTNIIFNYFVENIGWNAELVAPEYCGICDATFTSVLPSISHYTHAKHDSNVRKWIVDSLWDHNKVYVEDMDQPWFQNTVNRLIKKYGTKPSGWQCAICDVALSSGDMARSHFKGTQHQRRAKGLPIVEKVPRDFVKAFENHCAACNVDFRTREEAGKHTETKFHMMNVTACAQHDISLPPGPSSTIGRSKIARGIWRAHAQPAGTAIAVRESATGSNTTPLGAKYRAPGQIGFFPAAQEGEQHTCALCNKTFYSESPYLLHMASQQHAQREFQAAKVAMKGEAVRGMEAVNAPGLVKVGKTAKIDPAKLELLRQQAARRKKMVTMAKYGPNQVRGVNYNEAKGGAPLMDPSEAGAVTYGRQHQPHFQHHPQFNQPRGPRPPRPPRPSVTKKVAASIVEQAKSKTWVSGGNVSTVQQPPGPGGFVGSWAPQ